MPLTDDVAEAIDTIRSSFEQSTVAVEEDGQGGAWVVVNPVPTGPSYVQDSTWIAFQVPFLSPTVDVYPHFVRPDLTRRDGAALDEGFQLLSWGPRAEPAIQVSRRNNSHNPNVDTATFKLLKVLEWVSSR
jgi:hypothetical protein